MSKMEILKMEINNIIKVNDISTLISSYCVMCDYEQCDYISVICYYSDYGTRYFTYRCENHRTTCAYINHRIIYEKRVPLDLWRACDKH